MGIADSNYKVTEIKSGLVHLTYIDGRQRLRSLLEIAVAFLVVAVEDIGPKVLVAQVQLPVGVYSDHVKSHVAVTYSLLEAAMRNPTSAVWELG
ncbi:hypothetical protein FF1_045128 [Malus domestica]